MRVTESTTGRVERAAFCAHAVSVHLLDLQRSAAVVHFTSCSPCGDGPRPEMRVVVDLDALVLLRSSADHAIVEMGGGHVAMPDARAMPIARAAGGRRT